MIFQQWEAPGNQHIFWAWPDRWSPALVGVVENIHGKWFPHTPITGFPGTNSPAVAALVDAFNASD